MKARPWALGRGAAARDDVCHRHRGQGSGADLCRQPARAAAAAAAARLEPGHLKAAQPIHCPSRALFCSLANIWWRSSGRSGRSSMLVRGWRRGTSVRPFCVPCSGSGGCMKVLQRLQPQAPPAYPHCIFPCIPHRSTIACRLQGAERPDQGVVSGGGGRGRRHQLLAAHNLADCAAGRRPARLWYAVTACGSSPA